MKAKLELYNSIDGYCIGDGEIRISVVPSEGDKMRIRIGSNFDDTWTVFKVTHILTGSTLDHEHQVEIVLVRT